jgi:hypothetical protein
MNKLPLEKYFLMGVDGNLDNQYLGIQLKECIGGRTGGMETWVWVQWFIVKAPTPAGDES